MEYTATQAKILEVGKKEFLAKGFKDASLRGIVKEAGFTQGAFYGYYPDKAALFEAIVSPVCDVLMQEFAEAQQEHFNLIPQDKASGIWDLSRQYLSYFINYMYDHFDVFKLVICHSEGTKYENFVHELVELDIKRSKEFLDTLKAANQLENGVSDAFHHMIISAYYASFFELIVHDVPREQAMSLSQEIFAFFESGWNGLLKYQ